MRIARTLAGVVMVSAGLSSISTGQEAPALSLKAHIALPNVDGRMDHFAADVKGQRLFVSALGNHTVEVLDLQAGRRAKTLTNLEEPQGLFFDASTNRLFVATGDGATRIYDGTTLQQGAPRVAARNGADGGARVEVRRGPELINREQGQRRMVVMSNVRGRDLGSFVAEVRSRIDREMNLPPGYFIEYGGQFENQQRATRRLMLIVPVVLGLIFVLLFLTFNSFRLALLVVGNIPLALVGGITALWMRGMNLNLSASVDGINRSVLDSGLERARPVITRPARSYLAGSGQASAHCARVAPKKVLGPQSSFLCLRTIQA
jgi:hypothetical protein